MVPYLRAANVKDGYLDLSDVKEMNFTPSEQKRYNLVAGDVLVTEGCGSLAQLGAAAVWNGEIDPPVCLQNTLLRLRPRPGTDGGFMAVWATWAFRSGLFSSIATGTNIFHLGVEQTRQLPLLLPPLVVQRRVVDLIEAVDTYAAAARTLRDALKQAIAAMRRSYLSDAELPSRPLGSVAALQRGYDLPESDRRAGPYPVIASAGPVGSHDEAKVLGPGVVTGRSCTIGRVMYVESDFWPLNTTLYVKDFFGNEPRFICRVLEELDLGRYAGGSTVPSLNRNVLSDVPVAAPPLERQIQIADDLDALRHAHERASKVVASGAAVRRTLTNELLSGEREIPESYDELVGLVA